MADKHNIPLKGRYLNMLENIFRSTLGESNVEIYLYGSRAKGSEQVSSDIDLAVKSRGLSPAVLSKVRESLHESHIPYKVDLVELDKINEDFRKEVGKDGILIWKN